MGEPLTALEARVLMMWGDGMTAKAIAHDIHRSVRTVEHILARTRRKYDVDSTRAAYARMLDRIA